MNYNAVEDVLRGELPEGMMIDQRKWQNYLNIKKGIY